MPLANRLRPKDLSEIVGQDHIIGEGKLLNNMLKNNFLPNLIFYGPPGTGKTTVAEIIAKEVKKKIYKLNATTSSTSEIKKVIESIGGLDSQNGILLCIDEIHNFNKKQQQTILEFIETGDITLIACTTENPYHNVFKAILSRSTILEFKQIDSDGIRKGLENAVKKIKEDSYIDFELEKSAIDEISFRTNGDMRSALNLLEVSIYSINSGEKVKIDEDYIKNIPVSTIMNSDASGDVHYDLLSAFQKSIRGSDIDASIHYLARLVHSGDLLSICRRLMVIASEDVGLAYPMAISIVKSCVDAARELGFPEARIPLAQAVVLLAGAPKSNSSYMAINNALRDLDEIEISDVPLHLKDAHYRGASDMGRGVEYKYPHDYKNSFYDQEYLPDSLREKKYYMPKDNKFEKAIDEYMKKIRRESK